MTVNLAVAGLGWLGESLIKDAVRDAEFAVVAVQDVVAGRADEIAARYDVGHAFSSFDELIACRDVEAVAICTPNALHAQQAQLALHRGRDVLVQKPLALSQADAEATIAAAHATGRMLFVDYTYRFLETMDMVRQSLTRIGRVQSINAEFHNIYGPGAEKRWFFDRAQSGGGALTDLGVHLLDLGLWLVAPSVAELDSVSLRGDGPVESAANLHIQLDQVRFELTVSWNAPLPTTIITLEVRGSSGVVRWENVDGSFFRFRTLLDNQLLLDRETTLREDTLHAFAQALDTRQAPSIDARVYALLDQAYASSTSSRR